VANYSVVVKSSAQKELDALDDSVFRRIDRRILALTENPG
jgi:mRNA-degrading endonuclease RelE of RelBE toxin-antitoxin system